MKSKTRILESSGFNLSEIVNPIDYDTHSGYVKIAENVQNSVDSLLQIVPDLTVDSIIGKTFIAELPDGINGVMAHHNDGLLGIIRNRDTGKFEAQVTWHPSAELLPSIGLFQTLSFVTSQHYLHQINQKLTTIQEHVNAILEFLYTDKFCEIYAELKNAYRIYKNYEVIANSESLRTASITTVQHARIIGEKNIEFFYRDMNRLVNKNDLKSVENKLREDMACYEQSVNLYGLSAILELVLSQTFETQYMQQIYDEFEDREEKHKLFFAKLDGKTTAQQKGSAIPLPIKVAIPGIKQSKIIEDFRNAIEEKVPIQEYQTILTGMINSYSQKTEFVITGTGNVYKKKSA